MMLSCIVLSFGLGSLVTFLNCVGFRFGVPGPGFRLLTLFGFSVQHPVYVSSLPSKGYCRERMSIINALVTTRSAHRRTRGTRGTKEIAT